jgi:predicted AAA+ superfamily ATPase
MIVKRDIEESIQKIYRKIPVIVVTGPRQSGKTTLCKNFFSSKKYINLEELDKRDFALSDPKGFLNQYGYDVIIDEIQRAPQLLSYIQVIVDENPKAKFILTGSSQFELMSKITQSLAGRAIIVRLLPFSLKELKVLYKNKMPDVFSFLIKGFYPRLHINKIEQSIFYGSYISTYIERDLRLLINLKDLHLFQKFLKLCAGRIGNILNLSSLANDIGVSHTTVKTWINLLETSNIIFLLKPYYKNISKRLIKSPKLYFYDTGIAAYLLGIETKEQLLRDPLRGALFENLVISEFIKMRFNNLKDNNLYFYRDSNGTEIDLMCVKGNEIIPIEIKSGETITDEYFKNIKKIKHSLPNICYPSVIYAGNDIQMRTDINVYSYFDINNLFKNIK